jgi:hypothetical protein
MEHVRYGLRHEDGGERISPPFYQCQVFVLEVELRCHGHCQHCTVYGFCNYHTSQEPAYELDSPLSDSRFQLVPEVLEDLCR